MPLYLVRHGEAYADADDPARSLTETGKATVYVMAQLTTAFKIPVAKILHSGKARARQTAEIFSEHLKPPGGIAEIKNINPGDDITKIIPQLDPTSNTMIVGHLPFMESLVSCLVAGSPQLCIVEFQTGGVVCLDRNEKNRLWHIKWVLMPNMV